MSYADLPEMDLDSWRDRSNMEVSFWDNWILTGGARWPEDFKRKTDPDAPLEPVIADFLPQLDLPVGRPIRILDIGAGPLSCVGTRHTIPTIST